LNVLAELKNLFILLKLKLYSNYANLLINKGK